LHEKERYCQYVVYPNILACREQQRVGSDSFIRLCENFSVKPMQCVKMYSRGLGKFRSDNRPRKLLVCLNSDSDVNKDWTCKDKDKDKD